jgi:hypothetical protein
MADNEHDVNRSASTGKFVKDSTVERHPDKTTTDHVTGNSGDGGHETHRSASTGKFVKEGTAERHPSTTETQKR